MEFAADTVEACGERGSVPVARWVGEVWLSQGVRRSSRRRERPIGRRLAQSSVRPKGVEPSRSECRCGPLPCRDPFGGFHSSFHRAPLSARAAAGFKSRLDVSPSEISPGIRRGTGGYVKRAVVRPPSPDAGGSPAGPISDAQDVLDAAEPRPPDVAADRAEAGTGSRRRSGHTPPIRRQDGDLRGERSPRRFPGSCRTKTVRASNHRHSPSGPKEARRQLQHAAAGPWLRRFA